MKYIYIFNLLTTPPISKPTIEVDMFFEIDGEVFDDKHRLHQMSNTLPSNHLEKIKQVSNSIRMMEVRLKFQQSVCSGLLRIDSDEKITRESLKSVIDSTDDIDGFISKYKFHKK